MPKLDPKYKELRGRVFMVDPRELIVDLEHNARRYMPKEVEDLAFSMHDYGQIQDVMVRRTEAGKLTVVAGNLRTQAGRYLIEQKLKEDFQLRCYLMDYDDPAAFERSVVENWQRKDPSIIDTAYNLRRLLDLTGKSQGKVAEMYHRTPAWISQTLSLLTLPVQLQKMVHDGEVPAAVAYELSLRASPKQINIYLEYGAEGRPITLEGVRRFLREIPAPNDTAAEPTAPEPKQLSWEPRKGPAPTPVNNIKSLNIPEAKDQESRTIPLTRKEIARFWEEMAKDVPEGQKPKPINQFAQAVVKWMAGTKGYGDRKMRSVLEDVRYSGRG